MKTLPSTPQLVEQVVGILQQSPLFASMVPDSLRQVATRAAVLDLSGGEPLTRQGDVADAFFVLLSGEAVIQVVGDNGEPVEVGRTAPPESVGEIGLLLGQARTANVVAVDRLVVARFDAGTFTLMFENVPGFGLAITRGLANRLHQVTRPKARQEKPAPAVLGLLPAEFVERHRVVPLRMVDNVLTLGFPEEPSPRVIMNVRGLMPSVEVRSERVDLEFYNDVVRTLAASRDFGASKPSASQEPERSSPRLDAMLRRVAAEGASDLHLSGGQRPRWRVDGHIQEIDGASVMGPRDVWELFEPVLDARARKQFEEENDVDFAYSLPDVARFRVNLFRDKGGVGAVMRQVPCRILTMEQLGLPPVLSTLCSQPKGLVLVTGPTGSGKSTTLAAMVDLINRTRREHIVTLEDPVEFMHQSQKSLVNQREIGPHTASFHRALKAALREDPNIVMVGEMRDLETVSLALETANTGHLVFGTLHTSSAVGTVDRIIDLFPVAQQNQVRNVLADSLRGIVTQVLCRKTGGGRVAALEILVVNLAVANMIREGKLAQIASHMATNRQQGNVLLNEALGNLVMGRKVEFDEALSKTLDRADLARRCNRELPSERAQAAQQMAAAVAHTMGENPPSRPPAR